MHEERGESPSITYTEKNEAEGKTVKTQTAVRKVGGEMEPLQCERKSVDYIFFFESSWKLSIFPTISTCLRCAMTRLAKYLCRYILCSYEHFYS